MISLLDLGEEAKREPQKIEPYLFDQTIGGTEDSGSSMSGISELKGLAEFTEEAEDQEEAEAADREREEEEKPVRSEAERKVYAMMEAAENEAASIIATARKKAADIEAEARQEGYEKGYKAGRLDGEEQALNESHVRLEKEEVAYLQELQIAMSELESRKDALVADYCNDLCDLVLTIAEKVIKVSLKTSSEVIKNMILAATERHKNKAWARIHISSHDASLMVHEDVDMIDAISQISPHIKVIVMESEEPGACIIELPDQIIDAGVNTQLENIKELIKENRNHGGQ